jgi:signal transduction histidine kinase
MGDKTLSEEQKLILWFIHLRWGAILLILSVIITSIFPGRLRIPLIPNFIIIGIAILYNLLYPFIVRRFRPFSENITFTYLRVTADLLVVTFLIHFTGGVESPFKLLYLLELTAIAITGFERAAYLLAAQGAALFWLVCFLESNFFIRHYRLIDRPGTLYLNINYCFSLALALLLCSILIIYISSYLAERLREKQRQVEELSRAKLDFVNIVMHETKSPLTSIIGYTDLLDSQSLGPITEKQKEPLGVIKRQSQRILAMANDLLSLARIESGMAKIDKKPASLAELTGRVIEEFGPQLEERKISLIQEFDPKLPDVPLDEDKMIEVFTNLFSNAIKFSDNGGKIFLSISPRDKEVLVSIRDEGLGIEPADLLHIFEKFHRGSKESAERKGTGLGLTLVKSIIESHGGKIWAVSAGRGQGAVFYFTLPV